jgi:hypothetical protein
MAYGTRKTIVIIIIMIIIIIIIIVILIIDTLKQIFGPKRGANGD